MSKIEPTIGQGRHVTFSLTPHSTTKFAHLQFYEFGAFQSISASLDIWGFNNTLTPLPVTLELFAHDLTSDWTHGSRYEGIILAPNQSTEIVTELECPCPPHTTPATDYDQGENDTRPRPTTSHTVVVSARLLDANTNVSLAHTSDWPQPYKYLDFSPDSYDPGLSVKVDGDEVKLRAKRPVKCVVISVADTLTNMEDDKGDDEVEKELAKLNFRDGLSDAFGDGVKWSDNAMDLVPGDDLVVVAKGLRGRRVRIAYLGREEGYVI